MSGSQQPAPSAPQQFNQSSNPNIFSTSANLYNRAAGMAGQNNANSTSTYSGATVSAPGNIQAGQLANTNLSPYMNPYQQEVIDGATNDLNSARQIAINDVGSQASAAGAFGGSRHGVAEAQTNTGFADQVARTSGQLRQAGYQNAQNAAFQDIGNRFAADQTNQGMQMQAALANQASRNQAGQFNASQRNQTQANQALQMGQLANLGFNMGTQMNNNMMQQGAMQQGLQQSVMDRARGQFQGYANAPMQSLQTRMAALSGTPAPTSQTTSKQPGLMDFASLAMPFL